MRKRNLYKPERAPARTVGQVRFSQPPSGMPDASSKEVSSALHACCLCMTDSSGNWLPLTVGRCLGYNQHTDKYTVLARNEATGKPGEYEVEGEAVVALIHIARMAEGGKLDTGKLTSLFG